MIDVVGQRGRALSSRFSAALFHLGVTEPESVLPISLMLSEKGACTTGAIPLRNYSRGRADRGKAFPRSRSISRFVQLNTPFALAFNNSGLRARRACDGEVARSNGLIISIGGGKIGQRTRRSDYGEIYALSAARRTEDYFDFLRTSVSITGDRGRAKQKRRSAE